MRAIFSILLISLSQLVVAETIKYEIYELSKVDSQNVLIAKGQRDYTIKDVEIRPYERSGRKIAEKLIELEQGYKVGARIFYERQLTGFGLLAKRSCADFSWEWYNKESGYRFKKLQGGTYVQIKTTGLPLIEELTEVEFLEDTKLSFITNRQGMDDTHDIIIKAGSVFKFK
ncbi:MAG: hypothetical protein JAY98_01130 [Candidatus Thiodiazotropha lotti]|nr:hypothetical protein [Candidatus Thiodiazotropha lotti]